MITKSLTKPGAYYDSIVLMLVAAQLREHPGVVDAAVVMATEANKSVLKAAGLLTPEAEAATPNDLIISVGATDEASAAALDAAEGLLERRSSTGSTGEYRPRSITEAVKTNPRANLAVISVAGRYAAREAWEALRQGLHVLLFSDNVSLDDEVALKQYARDHGLFLIGPGAGTTILNGVALGFANVLLRGPVGIVSAAGTGLQEVSTLLAKQGIGISQGIGTGGRDLHECVGGIMMLQALKALQADPATRVIALVSKPPAPSIAELIFDQVAQGDKPTIVGFMGSNPQEMLGVPNVIPARTLQETALLASRAAGASIPDVDDLIRREAGELEVEAAGLRAQLAPGQRYLRGLFSGGTLCYEAQVVWRDFLPEPVFSNAPLPAPNPRYLADSTRSEGDTAVDLGEEEFTVGRPHPMIDNDLRIRRLLQEACDPEVAAVMLDVVIGYGAHPDPASELGPAIEQARALAREAGRSLAVVASVTGTEEDPQRLSRQVGMLQAAGATVCTSNAAAARLAGMIVSR